MTDTLLERVEPQPVLFTSSPCTTDGIEGHWNGQWMVWDMYQDLPPKPVFVGEMEEASQVADALNRKAKAGQP